jgi:hypothetical protein
MTTTKAKIESDYSTKMKGMVSKYGETVAQGIAFALGGLIVNGMANRYKGHQHSQLIASEENILAFDKAANS